MSRETVRCRACGRVHLMWPRSEIPELEREQYEPCARCGSRDGFVQSQLLNDELLDVLPVCVAPETPREGGGAIGLYEFSDAEVLQRIRERGGTR